MLFLSVALCSPWTGSSSPGVQGAHVQKHRESESKQCQSASLDLEGRSTDASSSRLRASGARSPLQQTLTGHRALGAETAVGSTEGQSHALRPHSWHSCPLGIEGPCRLSSRPSALSPVPGTEIISGLFSNRLLDGVCVFCICQRPF